jgi:hypothetical protein
VTVAVPRAAGPAGVSVSGSTLTWTAGSLLPGATPSVDVVLELAATDAMAGSVVDLLSALSASGTDLATGGARTATAPKLTVGPVAAANHAPVAGDDVLSVPEDGSGAVDLLANDTDADGGTLAVTVTDQPDHGTAGVVAGVATYTPAPGYEGPDSFAYEVCDTAGACDTATVTVTVTHVNHPPAAPPGTSFATQEGTAKSGTLPGSTDPDGDPLTFAKASDPAHGTVVVNADGTFTYTPVDGYVGGDSFDYEVCDPGGLCASATATVTVTAGPPPNATPVAVDDAVSTPSGTPVTFDPAANDADADGDALTVTVPVQPAHGTVTVDGNDVTYTPDPGYAGVDTVTYTVCDPDAACDTGVVTVTVGPQITPVNQPPVADAGAAQQVASGAAVTLDGTGSHDPDLDPLTYDWAQTAGPAVTLDDPHGATPSFAGVTGPATLAFRLTVSDGQSSATDTTTVVVAAAVTTAPAPERAPLDVETEPGEPVTVRPCDGGLPTVVVEPGHGTAEVLDDGTVRYEPEPGFTGTDTFTVRVCTLTCVESVVTVEVRSGVHAAPFRTADLPRTGGPVGMLVAGAFVLIFLGIGCCGPTARSRRRA